MKRKKRRFCSCKRQGEMAVAALVALPQGDALKKHRVRLPTVLLAVRQSVRPAVTGEQRGIKNPAKQTACGTALLCGIVLKRGRPMKKMWLQVAALVWMSFILGCSEFLVVGILSDIAASLQIPVTQAGDLVTVFALVYALVTPLVTTLLGRYRHYTALLVLTVLFILGNLLSFFSSSYGSLLASRILTAVVSGPMISLGFTFVDEMVPPEKRAKAVSYVFSGFSIASVLGVPAGTWISVHAGWRYSFLTIVVLSLAVLALLAVLLPRTGALPQAKGKAGNLQILRDRRIQIGVLLPLFSAAGFYVFYTYLRPILMTSLHYPASAVSTVLFLYGLTSIASNLLSGVLAEKGGLRRMPWVFLLQAVLFLVLQLFLHSQMGGTVEILLLGVTMYLLNAPIQLHFFAVAETDYPGSMVLASSFNSIFFNFGISLGSFVGGLLVSGAGLSSVGYGSAGFALLTVGLLVWLNQLNRQHRAAA